METYTMNLYVGCNVDDKPTYTQDFVIDTVTNYLEYDFTAIKTIGRYKGIKENSVQFTFYDLIEDVKELNKIIKDICNELRQESILQVIDNNSVYITSKSEE